jgi:adenylate cyclase
MSLPGSSASGDSQSTAAPAASGGIAVRRGFRASLRRTAQRHPFLAFLAIVILSNAVGSYFNITYNHHLIIEYALTPAQARAFWRVIVPAYNGLGYALGLGLIVGLFGPVARCYRRLREGREVPDAVLKRCRQRLINLPFYQVILNFLLWIPGALIFPLGICLLGGWDGASQIWVQFAVSFTISALLTSVQTFFLVEEFLIAVLYKEFFRDARPAEAEGVLRVSFGSRVFLLWASIAFMPLLALVVVSMNFTSERIEEFKDLRILAVGVAGVALAISGLLMWMVGGNILKWVHAHAAATARVAGGVFTVRIEEQRPDEWGRLTDGFNDMAAALEKGRYVRETFGQFVSSDVCEQILQKYPGLGGGIETVTVLFADIRGFTKRSTGESPRDTVALLNRFLNLAVAAVEENGGWVNKFLGDGFMALFGAPRLREDHARIAVDAARDLLRRLSELNAELVLEGRDILRVGIGIHTGPALVGCVGASLLGCDGNKRVRREFTAIGETVNLAQRLEQLTKTHGGPILLSDVTARLLERPPPMTPLGEVPVPGYEGLLAVHRAGEECAGTASPQGRLAASPAVS